MRATGHEGIATGRFQDKGINDATHYAVRTSRGAPRFPLRYTLEETMWEAAPSRECMSADTEQEYQARYEAGLEKIGHVAIMARLGALRERAGGRQVVLMCFCDLEHQFCHRRMLSRWLLKKTKSGLAEISQPPGGKR